MIRTGFAIFSRIKEVSYGWFLNLNVSNKISDKKIVNTG
jgi:hypothetical protein